MIITNTTDLSLVDCCGCPPVACGEPRQECEEMIGIGYVFGRYDSSLYDTDRDAYLETRYKNERLTWLSGPSGAGHWTNYSDNTAIGAKLGDKLISANKVTTITEGGGNSYVRPATTTLSDPVTWEDSINEIASLFVASKDWDDVDITKGSSATCSTFLSLKRVDFIAGPNRPFDIKMSFVRYRFGVPYAVSDMPKSTYEAQWDIYAFPPGWIEWNDLISVYDAAVAAHAAWPAAHAAWVAAMAIYDAEIEEYYAAINAWYYAASDWETYYYLHQYWEVFPEDFPEGEPQPPAEALGPEPTPPPYPGPEPIEPVVPPDPGPWNTSPLNTCDDTIGPVFVSSESWIWDGNMGAANDDPELFAKNPEQWSPWFDLPNPEIPSPLSDVWDRTGTFGCAKQFRVCNMMTKCYKSTRFGVVPTIYPPIYNPPAP